MLPDDRQSQDDSSTAYVPELQAQVSRLRQDVATTRTMWRMERAEYRNQRRRLSRLLKRVNKSPDEEANLSARLARRLKQIELQEQRVDEVEGRIIEVEDVLDQAEAQLYSGTAPTTHQEVVFTPPTTLPRSDLADLDHNESDIEPHPVQLEQYYEHVEEVRALRETLHNLQVDQVLETGRRSFLKDSGETTQESDFAFLQRHLQQREPLTRKLIKETTLAEQAHQHCLRSGIPAPGLDEMVPPLDVSGLPSSWISATATSQFGREAYQINHLELSLLPMAAIDERITQWTQGVTSTDTPGVEIPTAVPTPRTSLRSDVEDPTLYRLENMLENDSLRSQELRHNVFDYNRELERRKVMSLKRQNSSASFPGSILQKKRYELPMRSSSTSFSV